MDGVRALQVPPSNMEILMIARFFQINLYKWTNFVKIQSIKKVLTLYAIILKNYINLM